MSYASESAALDGAILDVIDAWRYGRRTLDDDAFDALALRLFDYQRRYNRPYARFCAALGMDDGEMPDSWERIPAVPAAAFKEAALATFPIQNAVLSFETSGTTRARSGKHYFETSRLYDAALLAGFERFMLPDGARLHYLNLVPNPAMRPASSLGYMMGRVSHEFGSGASGWYVDADTLDFERFADDLRDARLRDRPVCIATTAFALVAVLDRCAHDGIVLPLPPGSRIMETGGFKGRSRIVERDELYRVAAQTFSIGADAIVAEYGMTELTSQYYDAPSPHATASDGVRYKRSPPWLRPRVVGPDGQSLPNGIVGALVHVDLANRASCVAVATEDVGVKVSGPSGDTALVLIDRERGAELRGCSLDAESLRAVR